MSFDQRYASRLGEEPLTKLVEALGSHVPMVVIVATATIWNLSTLADVRTTLVLVSRAPSHGLTDLACT